jgi:hypothetical protein
MSRIQRGGIKQFIWISDTEKKEYEIGPGPDFFAFESGSQVPLGKKKFVSGKHRLIPLESPGIEGEVSDELHPSRRVIKIKKSEVKKFCQNMGRIIYNKYNYSI